MNREQIKTEIAEILLKISSNGVMNETQTLAALQIIADYILQREKERDDKIKLEVANAVGDSFNEGYSQCLKDKEKESQEKDEWKSCYYDLIDKYKALQEQSSELASILREVHSDSSYQLSSKDDRAGYLSYGLYDKVTNILTLFKQSNQEK